MWIIVVSVLIILILILIFAYYGTKKPDIKADIKSDIKSGEIQTESIYSPWSEWMQCSEKCDGGIQNRNRQCVAGVCDEEVLVDSELCNTEFCPSYSSWTSKEDDCSKSCGSGIHTESRVCQEGTCPQSELIRRESCNNQICPAYSEWTSVSGCSKLCNDGNAGLQTQNRKCTAGICQESSLVQQISCNVQPCAATYDDWHNVGNCTKTCGGGVQAETRSCKSGACSKADLVQSVTCNNQNCPVNSVVGVWSEYVACNKVGGEGSSVRTRQCSEAEFGGTPCPILTESNICPVDSIQVLTLPYTNCIISDEANLLYLSIISGPNLSVKATKPIVKLSITGENGLFYIQNETNTHSLLIDPIKLTLSVAPTKGTGFKIYKKYNGSVFIKGLGFYLDVNSPTFLNSAPIALQLYT